MIVGPPDSEPAEYEVPAARRLADEMHLAAQIEEIADPDFAADGFALAAALVAAADEIEGWAAR